MTRSTSLRKGYSQVLGPIRANHGLWISNDGFSSIFAHFTAQAAMGPGGEGWGPAFLFVSLYKNLHPDPASHAAGRVGGGRSSCGARRSRAGIGARQQPLWVTHTHQAGKRR